MRPTAAEILDTVIWTFDEQVLPTIGDELAKSLAFSISNLMRHVKLRIELEPAALVEDNADLHRLLGEIDDFARVSADLEVGSRFRAAAGTIPSQTGDLAELTEQSTILRWGLCDAIEALQGVRAERGGDPDYVALRRKIWDYHDRSLDREAKWIVPAFTGPRR